MTSVVVALVTKPTGESGSTLTVCPEVFSRTSRSRLPDLDAATQIIEDHCGSRTATLTYVLFALLRYGRYRYR